MSVKIATNSLWFVREYFRIFSKRYWCSTQPEIFGRNPFWEEAIMAFWVKKHIVRVARIEVNNFDAVHVNAMGRKLPGSSVLPFLWIKTSLPLRQIKGVAFADKTQLKMEIKEGQVAEHNL
jgi:hypothetical protein